MSPDRFVSLVSGPYNGYGTAHVRGEARSGVLGPARLLAAVEAGAMTGGIDLRADDRPVLAMRGLWLSLALGVRVP